jgi:hypothetical protein
METREDILKELREIAPQLASLEKVNAYQLPDSYFANFNNKMLDQVRPVDVKQELLALAPTLLKLQKPANPDVPAAYFTGFSTKLIQQVRAHEVAKELASVAPSLSALNKINTLEAPAGYFSSFADRIWGDVVAQSQPQKADSAKWLEGLNVFLDGVVNAVFKPKYSFAFAGMATTIILGVLMFVKVQQCDDLDCKFAQLSTEDINSYLDQKSDAYADEVFEMNLDTKGVNENVNYNSLHPYKEALKNVDDAALNEAIAD